MKKLNKSFRANSGFTLIELLIVIVIIGILAGVLIAVINPVRQQNRARNAAVRAAILKVAFGVNTVRAGIGRLPAEDELTTELENITTVGTTCDTTGVLDCYFSVSGTSLPAICASPESAIPTNGSSQCALHLVTTSSDLRTGTFRIASAKFPLTPGVTTGLQIYLFDSSRGLLECDSTVVYAGAAADISSCVPVTE